MPPYDFEKYISSCVSTFQLFLRDSHIVGKKQLKAR